jgi:hypothetical protein
MIGFADGFILRNQCDTKKAARKISLCFDAWCRLVSANSDCPAGPHSDLSTFQNTGVAGPSTFRLLHRLLQFPRRPKGAGVRGAQMSQSALNRRYRGFLKVPSCRLHRARHRSAARRGAI